VAELSFDQVLEARRVRHEVAERDRLAEIWRDLEIEVVVDVAIQIELAQLHLLHHRCPSEELADRTGAEQRPLGIDRLSFLNIGVAVALLQ
jgi:hypothetical protein